MIPFWEEGLFALGAVYRSVLDVGSGILAILLAVCNG